MRRCPDTFYNLKPIPQGVIKMNKFLSIVFLFMSLLSFHTMAKADANSSNYKEGKGLLIAQAGDTDDGDKAEEGAVEPEPDCD
jgi:hypothetical protein